MPSRDRNPGARFMLTLLPTLGREVPMTDRSHESIAWSAGSVSSARICLSARAARPRMVRVAPLRPGGVHECSCGRPVRGCRTRSVCPGAEPADECLSLLASSLRRANSGRPGAQCAAPLPWRQRSRVPHERWAARVDHRARQGLQDRAGRARAAARALTARRARRRRVSKLQSRALDRVESGCVTWGRIRGAQ